MNYLWYFSSVFLTPAMMIIIAVSGLGSKYSEWHGLNKHSDLPPFEYLPFLILPVIGFLFAYKGYKSSEKKWMLLSCLIINVIYVGFELFVITDIWFHGRT